jgi:hypothetical protein
MVIQIMDDKEQCFGIYTNGAFHYNKSTLGLVNQTIYAWSYNEKVNQITESTETSVEYLHLWTEGQNISEACPEHLSARYNTVEKKIKAHFNSFRQAKVHLSDVCFYELVPQKQLEHYYDCRNEICEWILENREKPNNYRHLHDTYRTIIDISSRKLNINKHKLYNLRNKDFKARSMWKRFGEDSNITVNYNIFGSVTGRLTTKPDSFPIMNIKTELRDIVRPTNDVFIELDFNAAEIRTLISLSKQQQPEGDIHEFNQKEIFEGATREEAKTRFFAWLYNRGSKAIQSDFYSRERVLGEYYREGNIHTPFGRKIECGEFHALNYLLQSTSSDNCMDRVNKINKFLIGTKSHVAFTVHDCVVIDMSFEDRNLIPQIKQIFEDTKLGHFMSSVHIGRDLGNMEKLEW